MNTYRVSFSIYGANAGWKSSIVSAVTVKADTKDEAIQAAKDRVPNLTDADIVGVGI